MKGNIRLSQNMNRSFLFLYLAYGSWQFRKEAVLSISSLLEKGPVPGKILVFTDRPREFDDLPVETVLVTKRQIRKWRGPYGYTHRVKIELVRNVLEQYRTPIIFVDSDSYWTNSPEHICRCIEGGFPVMHEKERALSQSFFPDYLAVIKRTAALEAEGLPSHVPEKLWIYNSGIIGLPGDMDPDLLDQVARFCDFLCRSAPFRMEWVEQVAFSYIFQSLKLEIKTCTDDLCHYWRDSFEFSRQIKDMSYDELKELGRDGDRIQQLIQAGKGCKRSFGNQVLVRIKRVGRSFRKRKREFLVYMEMFRLKVFGK
jgi:hypothetical protein